MPEHSPTPADPAATVRRLRDAQVSVDERIEMLLNLAERRDDDVYPVILELLSHPDFERRKGTLVYALLNYPPEPLFERAVDWLIHEGFEVAHLAFEILDSMSQVSGTQVDTAYELISRATPDHSWRADLLDQALGMFSPVE